MSRSVLVAVLLSCMVVAPRTEAAMYKGGNPRDSLFNPSAGPRKRMLAANPGKNCRVKPPLMTTIKENLGSLRRALKQQRAGAKLAHASAWLTGLVGCGVAALHSNSLEGALASFAVGTIIAVVPLNKAVGRLFDAGQAALQAIKPAEVPRSEKTPRKPDWAPSWYGLTHVVSDVWSQRALSR